MNVLLEIQNTVESNQLPNERELQRVVNKLLTKLDAKFQNPELTIRVVSEEESQQLNTDYRSIEKPTNILSFPFEAPEELPANECLNHEEDIGVEEYLGDLIICETVILKEAIEQGKNLNSHWIHIVIHGVLHLLGFDHIEENDAEEMEAIEINLMLDLGLENPYQ